MEYHIHRHTGFRKSAQISADALELCSRQRNGCRILGLRDTQMLLINVHELYVIFADSVHPGTLEDEVYDIWRVFSLQCEEIVVPTCAEHFGERAKVNAESNIAVASKRGEGVRSQQHGYESDVGVIHGLQRDAGVIAVEIAILHQVLDSIDNLEHSQVDLCVQPRVLLTFLRRLACSKRASSTKRMG